MEKEVYLAFYKVTSKGAKWDDVIVDCWTGMNGFSHVELVINDNGNYTMYSSSPRDGGVRMKSHRYNENTWEYVKIDLDPEHIELLFKMTDGLLYDWKGILGFILPFKDRSTKWFCSEWCSNTMKTGGYVKFFLKEPASISPNQLYTIVANDKFVKTSKLKGMIYFIKYIIKYIFKNMFKKEDTKSTY